MSSSFHKTTSNLFLAVFIGLIVLSFVVTGFYDYQTTNNGIGSVGGIPIRGQEFDAEYNRQLEFYGNLFNGGKPLSSKQMNDFKIRENALKNLVQRKVLYKLAEEMGALVAPEALKDEIKKIEAFKSNDVFDITRYKALLQANRLTPEDFEEDTKYLIMAQMLQGPLSRLKFSKNYKEEVDGFRKQRVRADIVKIEKDSLQKYIVVSNQEVDEFLARPENLAKVEKRFEAKKSGLAQEEEVEARHILIKSDKNEDVAKIKIEKIAKEVTPQNFAEMAKKYTEEPGGKQSGGALGRFGRGRMVREFEDVAFSQKVGTISAPIKTQFGHHLIYIIARSEKKEALFEEHKKLLAIEILRDDKKIDFLLEKVTSDINSALNAQNTVARDALVAKYGLQIDKNTEINRLDGNKGQIKIIESDLGKIFSVDDLTQKRILQFDSVSTILFVSTSAFKEDAKNEKDETDSMAAVLGRSLLQDAIKAMEERVKVKISRNVL